MCGIAGILTTTLAPEVSRAAAERMQCALMHRGPDDSGLWQSPDNTATFAHRRLSILDLSGAGRQPMTSPDGRFTICFNGEIYNFRELRHRLEQEGIVFHTSSDTEVLLRLYEHEGIDCIKHLRGMFAFAIWDAEKRTCALARDPFGIKPLYFHHTSTSLVFASELQALTQSRLFVPTASQQGVARYLQAGSVPEPLTLLNEASCLPAGAAMIWKEGAVTRREAESLTFTQRTEFDGDPVAVTRKALLDSVQHHFVSDVPVGVFLSGGIDSTAILALANASGHQGISAFSVAVDDAASDESPIARRTASHFGANYHEMRLDAKKAQDLFESFLAHMDQPSIDGLNTFTVSAMARENSIKVVLSGLGGDELFGGYSSFARIPKMMRIHQALHWLPFASGLAASALERLGGSPQHRRMAEFLRSPGSVENAFASLRGVFSHAEATKLASWLLRAQINNEPDTQGTLHSGEVADEISRLELTRYMRHQLLRDSDVMSMAQGLELRVPLVDRVLFEAVAAIPARIRLQPGKRLLTQAVPEVPEWVINQKKRGFLFPYQKWLGGEWSASFDAASKGAPVPVVTWYQKWSLFVLRHCMTRLGVEL